MTTDLGDERFEVVEVPERARFELLRDGQVVGFADYRQEGQRVVVPYVETLRPHRGQGYGDRTMAGMLDILRTSGRTITPVCSFAAVYVAGHRDHQDLLA